MLTLVLVWSLFTLAVLNEMLGTAPGIPMAPPTPGDALIAAAIGLAVVGLGWFVNTRTAFFRPPPGRRHMVLAAGATAAGLALGGAVLLQAMILNLFDPQVGHRYARFAGESWVAPLLRAYGAGVLEEVIFRYVGMAGIALVAIRWRATPAHAWRIGLVAAAAVFGVLHIPGVSLSALVIVLVNTAAGLLFGWLYWRWGIMHAILAHIIAGVVIQTLGPRMFG
jgi:hypothetical protein